MPKTEVRLFRDTDGSVPLLEWLDKQPKKVLAKCMRAIVRLSQLGYELRRPEAEYLGNEIYALRVRYGHVNYRMLYFFYGRQAVVLSHGFVKERLVPPREIALAVRREEEYRGDPLSHTAALEKGGPAE